jgi:hypothetical protein
MSPWDRCITRGFLAECFLAVTVMYEIAGLGCRDCLEMIHGPALSPLDGRPFSNIGNGTESLSGTGREYAGRRTKNYNNKG